MDYSIGSVFDVVRATAQRIPTLTVDTIDDPEGRAWRADPATGTVQINKALQPLDAARALFQALHAIEVALGHDTRAPLHLVPTQRPSPR